MKILHVARRMWTLKEGEESVRALARAQRARGDDAGILWVAEPGTPDPNDVTAVSIRRVAAPATTGREIPESRFEAVATSGVGRRLLAESGVDVFHCHAALASGAAVRTAAQRARVPYVLHLHDGDEDWPESRTDGGRPDGPAGGRAGWARLRAAVFGERSVLNDASLILTDSEAGRERALAEAAGRRVDVLPRGVDAARLRGGDGNRARALLGIPAGAPVLLTIASIGPKQNQEVLADVLAASPSAHAILAGPVESPGYEEKLRVRARAFGVDGRLHTAGVRAHVDCGFVDLYAAASAFVLPFREGSSEDFVLEAWSARVPVVVTRSCAGPVVDGDTGLVVEAGDARALAAAVARLLADETLRGGLAGRAVRLVAMRYDWPAVTARLHALYLEAGVRKKGDDANAAPEANHRS